MLLRLSRVRSIVFGGLGGLGDRLSWCLWRCSAIRACLCLGVGSVVGCFVRVFRRGGGIRALTRRRPGVHVFRRGRVHWLCMPGHAVRYDGKRVGIEKNAFFELFEHQGACEFVIHGKRGGGRKRKIE